MIGVNNLEQDNFFKHLLVGDKKACTDIVKTLINKKVSVQTIYEDVLKVALYKIGDLWEQNKISVATEHLASAIVEGILNVIYVTIISKKKINKNVLLSCVESENHQIGIKMISDVIEMNGWNTFFLGSNVPTREVLMFSKTVSIDLLAISSSIYFHLPELIGLIHTYRAEFPNTPILVGGQAFKHGGLDQILAFENVFYMPDINSTEVFLKEISNG